ncbi:phosphotransferase [Streptomyces sp. NPDC048182]|uniref:phosphotransferase n=1 Tax=Streptomyces sp. NPDC048182 TaxID=3365507 RepID=UPI00371F8FAE
MESSQLRRAVAAGRSTVSGLGLRVDEVVVLHDSDRVVLRLLPCDVVARVSPPGQLADAGFEVEVARRLAEVGAPVAVLDGRVEARMYRRDGFGVSLWVHYESVAAEVAPADYADVLRRHHTALRRIALDAPHFTDRVAAASREVKRSPELAAPDRRLLLDVLGGMRGPVGGAEQLLHGEPHPGNLLHTAGGPLLTDLPTCCRGPVEFDLAHAPEEVAAHYPGIDHALLQRCRALNWALFSAWRWRRDDRLPDRERWRVEGLRLVRSALAAAPGRAGGRRP